MLIYPLCVSNRINQKCNSKVDLDKALFFPRKSKLYLLQKTLSTFIIWCLKADSLTLPVVADQTLRVLSSEPDTIRLPENCRHVMTWSSWPFNTLGDRIGFTRQFISIRWCLINDACKSTLSLSHTHRKPNKSTVMLYDKARQSHCRREITWSLLLTPWAIRSASHDASWTTPETSLCISTATNQEPTHNTPWHQCFRDLCNPRTSWHLPWGHNQPV